MNWEWNAITTNYKKCNKQQQKVENDIQPASARVPESARKNGKNIAGISSITIIYLSFFYILFVFSAIQLTEIRTGKTITFEYDGNFFLPILPFIMSFNILAKWLAGWIKIELLERKIKEHISFQWKYHIRYHTIPYIFKCPLTSFQIKWKNTISISLLFCLCTYITGVCLARRSTITTWSI